MQMRLLLCVSAIMTLLTVTLSSPIADSNSNQDARALITEEFATDNKKEVTENAQVCARLDITRLGAVIGSPLSTFFSSSAALFKVLGTSFNFIPLIGMYQEKLISIFNSTFPSLTPIMQALFKDLGAQVANLATLASQSNVNSDASQISSAVPSDGKIRTVCIEASSQLLTTDWILAGTSEFNDFYKALMTSFMNEWDTIKGFLTGGLLSAMSKRDAAEDNVVNGTTLDISAHLKGPSRRAATPIEYKLFFYKNDEPLKGFLANLSNGIFTINLNGPASVINSLKALCTLPACSILFD